MTHDVDKLRRDLAGYAEQADFQISLEGVRQRAGRQRVRRVLAVTGVAVIAVLALVAPIALSAFDGPRAPTATGTENPLPEPEKGWRQVDGPIATGLRGSTEDTRIVLWFERRDNGVTRLMSGERDTSTGEITTPVRIGGSAGATGEVGHSETPGAGGFYLPPGDWSWPAFSQEAEDRQWGLFLGDAEKIEVMTRKDGKRVARPAKLARMSEDPRFVAYWVDGLGERTYADMPEDTAVKGYDADGNLIKLNFPPSTQPPEEGEDVADFDPATAPQLGEAIRTGAVREPRTGLGPGDGDDNGGEVVLSFHGKDGYAGVVAGLRDRDTGEVSHRRSATRAYKLPFTGSADIQRGEMPLGGGNGHTMAYGVLVGAVDKITAKVDDVDLPVGTARWSEDPNVTVWWVVIPTDQVEEDDASTVKLTIRYGGGTVSHD
ncbi:MAG: hypothetical protein GEU94_08225 [Micromonosporaceae bacterium]|nr:hypothetical protein [Micromonosporaceae bacterium]